MVGKQDMTSSPAKLVCLPTRAAPSCTPSGISGKKNLHTVDEYGMLHEEELVFNSDILFRRLMYLPDDTNIR